MREGAIRPGSEEHASILGGSTGLYCAHVATKLLFTWASTHKR